MEGSSLELSIFDAIMWLMLKLFHLLLSIFKKVAVLPTKINDLQ
jgi:hypothetical protein